MAPGAPFLVESLAAGSVVVAGAEFVAGQRNRQPIAPAIAPPQPLPLLAADPAFVEKSVADYHLHRHHEPPFDVSCYYLCDVRVSGIGHLFIDDALVTSPEIMPGYWRDNVLTHADPNIDIDIDRERALPERSIDGPTVVFCGWGIRVYGHFLIETLPKLLVARRALGTNIRRVRFLMPNDTPEWLPPMVAAVVPLGRDSICFYDPQREAVRLSHAVVPTLVSRNGWFHSFGNDIVSDAIALAGTVKQSSAQPRLFVSRALVTNVASVPRRCLNELRLAEIAVTEFGFSIVEPERLTWQAQIAAFSKATTVIGEFGSGLHNALFSPPDARVGCIGLLNLVQSAIGTLRRHRNAYLGSGLRSAGFYVVDESLFRAFLGAVVG